MWTIVPIVYTKKPCRQAAKCLIWIVGFARTWFPATPHTVTSSQQQWTLCPCLHSLPVTLTCQVQHVRGQKRWHFNLLKWIGTGLAYGRWKRFVQTYNTENVKRTSNYIRLWKVKTPVHIRYNHTENKRTTQSVQTRTQKGKGKSRIVRRNWTIGSLVFCIHQCSAFLTCGLLTWRFLYPVTIGIYRKRVTTTTNNTKLTKIYTHLSKERKIKTPCGMHTNQF